MIEQKKHDYEYAVLVGIINQEQTAQQVSDYMDELAFLTLTPKNWILHTPKPLLAAEKWKRYSPMSKPMILAP